MKKFELSDLLQRAAVTPSSILDISLDYLEARLDGDVIPDPIHPLVQLMEVSSAHSAFAIREAESGDRRNNPYLANDRDEVYGWMSNADHLNAFAYPGSAKLSWIVPRDELINIMVDVPQQKIKKVVIPRYTAFIVDKQYTFTLLYPIEIRLLPYGDGVLQIVYNTDNKTGIQTIENNLLDWDVFVNEQGRKFVRINIDCKQLKRKTENETLTEDLSKDYTMTFDGSNGEQFYYIRAFHSSDSINWKELRVTYDQIVRDIEHPTIVCKVYDTLISWYVPAIYKASGKVMNNVRIDVYTTKGDITAPFSMLKVDNYTMVVGDDTDDPDLSIYSGNVADLPVAISSTDSLHGGRDLIPFKDLRENIIYRRNIINDPITPEQLKGKLKLMGFDVAIVTDDLTDRQYYATKTLSSYGKDYYYSLKEEERPMIFNTAISSGIERLQTSIKELVTYPGVYDNGERCTISPKTLMSNRSGFLSLVKENEYPENMARGIETVVNYINAGSYLYTPFYYTLDATNNQFDLRAYYLDDAKIKQREFLHENTTGGFEVSTIAFRVERIDNGWQILFQTLVGESYANLPKSDLSVQLAFKPFQYTQYAHIPATLIGTEKEGDGIYYYWKAEILTNYDFTSDDSVIISNAYLNDLVHRELPIQLNQDFRIIYGVSNNMPGYYVPSEIDKTLGKFLMGRDPIALISERIQVELGVSLKDLAKPHRSIGGSRQFRLYENDIMAVYTDDVYEIDPVTQLPKFEIKDGKMIRKIIHRKGDPKLDRNGKQEVLHQKGTPILKNGEPEVISVRPTLCFVDLFVMDGIYFYANDQMAINERRYISEQIVYGSLEDLQKLKGKRLEKTSIHFYPKKTIGKIDLLVDDNRTYRTNSQLNFKVKITLSRIAFIDQKYRKGLERTITDTITDTLKQSTVAIKDIIASVSNISDENLIGLEVHMFSEGREYHTYSAKNDSVRCNIKRILRIADDMSLSVREDISFEYVEHDVYLNQ